MNFNSSMEIQFKASPTESGSNRGEEVFWIVNVKELFDIDLTFPGIKGALNAAFMAAKAVTPISTGLMRRSMTMIQIDNYRVKIFFDRSKIVGQKRKGVIVKDYYPIYLEEHAKTFNWLTILIKHFYDELYRQMKSLQKKHPASETKDKDSGTIAFAMFMMFKDVLDEEYKKKKEEAKKLKEEELAKKKFKKEYIKALKKRIKLENRKIEEAK